MKPAYRTPLVTLAICWAALALLIWITAGQFPERVATHFNAAGRADGWMNRSTHLWAILGLGLGAPVFLGLICLAIRAFGDDMLNLPNKAYWLAPERTHSVRPFIIARLLWLGCIEVAFIMALHLQILQANHRTPPRLDPMHAAVIGGLAVGAVIVWVVSLIIHFARKPHAAQA